MGMRYKPVFIDFSKEDYHKLDGSQKKYVLKSAARLGRA
jgi:hypothetical protein